MTENRKVSEEVLASTSGGRKKEPRTIYRINRKECISCGLCAGICPKEAIEAVFLQLYLHHLIQENLMIQISRPIVSAPLEFIRRCKDKYSIFNCISTAYSDLIPQIRDL
jgi:ferredoxin